MYPLCPCSIPTCVCFDMKPGTWSKNEWIQHMCWIGTDPTMLHMNLDDACLGLEPESFIHNYTLDTSIFHWIHTWESSVLFPLVSFCSIYWHVFRWRDIKLRSFDQAKHRTYVDLKVWFFVFHSSQYMIWKKLRDERWSTCFMVCTCNSHGVKDGLMKTPWHLCGA